MLRLFFIIILFFGLHHFVQAQSPVQNPFDYYRLLNEKDAGCGIPEKAVKYLFTKQLTELYEAPTTETPSLLIPGNKKVYFIEQDKKNPEWAEVCFAGYSGWVQLSYLDTVAPKNYAEQYVPLEPFEASLKKKNAVLRKLPANSAAVIEQLNDDDVFTVLSTQTVNGYYLANRVLGKTGWIKKNAIQRTGDAHIIDFNSERFRKDFENIGLKDTSYTNFNAQITIEYNISDTIRIYNGHRKFLLPPCNKTEGRCSVTIEAVPYDYYGKYFFVLVDGMHSYFYSTNFSPGSRYKFNY